MTLASIQKHFLSALVGLLVMMVALPVAAQDPYSKLDRTWITLDGEVKTVAPDVFTLDYGDGIISVEMDDGDRDADAYKLLPGDKVRVFGQLDDDFFQATTIEAASVYVEKLNTSFDARPADEEERPVTYVAPPSPVVISATIVDGVVTDVSDDSFMLNTGTQAIEVDVEEMTYDPLDNEGYQKIDVGDRVWVSGRISTELFEGREFAADSIVILHDADEAK